MCSHQYVLFATKKIHTKLSRSQKKRKLDKLVSAETIDGGKLREAATRKDDQRILVHILDKDCVALEVKYHKRCYERYTSFLRHPTTNDATKAEEGIYSKSFECFCSFVKEHVIDKHHIYYMNRLKAEFVKIVTRMENTDASNYRTFRLKERLRQRFPQLVFHTPRIRNKSEIVYVEELIQESTSAAEKLVSDQEESTTEDEEDNDDEAIYEQALRKRKIEQKDLYASALELRENIRNFCKPWYESWPPTSSDITGDSVGRVVSPLLFNFLSWMLGYTDEPQESVYVKMTSECTAKVFSICQDLVYNSSKGKTQTPKSLALAIAVRQISGCSGLIRILNGLGHCVSLSSTMAYDSALAQLNIETSDILPKEFIENLAINLVFDNIDFGEEVDKQTHVTNGIITQKVTEKESTLKGRPVKIKKSQRTVEVPQQGIMPFTIGSKKTPKFNVPVEQITDHQKGEAEEVAQLLDLAYVLIRMVPTDSSVLPGWTGFNTLLHKDHVPHISRVGYLPVIDASPTEYSTINAILQRSEVIADKLQLQYATLVFDEAVYAKIQHVRWKNDTFYDRFVVGLGEFHTIMAFLPAISRIYEDGGLKDVMIESGLVGEGSIKGVMTGKYYNKLVFCHKMMYEALQRLRFQEFLEVLDDETQESISSYVATMKNAFEEDNFQAFVGSDDTMFDLCQRYETFIEESSARSQTFAYWSMYIKMIDILLKFIRATREIDWELHLSSFRSMMPWFFACDRVNYARYGTAYWLEMTALEQTHPGVLQDLTSNFSVQRQQSYGFSAVACDQTIEQTANRDSKTKGGLVGFAMNRSSVHRWLLSQSERAAITAQCKFMAGIDCKTRDRKDLDDTKCQKHENSLVEVLQTVSNMMNPFSQDQTGLVNIASGVELQNDVACSLLEAEKLGEGQFSEFCQSNIFSDNPDIFKKIKRNKLKTFTSKTLTVKDSKGKHLAVKTSRNLLARLLILSRTSEVDLKGLLSYSLTEYPLSISTASGDLVKTAKSKMLGILEEAANNPVIDVERLGEGNALIVDAMAVLQVVKGNWKTFGDFADAVFVHLVNLCRRWKATRLDFVADRYPEVSIKNAERAKRAVQGLQKVHIYSKDQNIPKQWKKYMSGGENKESLIVLLCEHWSAYSSSQMKSLESMYVTSRSKCYLLLPSVSPSEAVQRREVPDLESDHEEADTRLLLHSKHAASTHSEIIVKSPDTDVFVLCAALQKTIGSNLYLMTGTGNRFRLIDISAVSDALGEDMCRCLPGFHAFTGCDTTSAFHGKGKLKPWKVLLDHPEFIETFTQFGSTPIVSEGLITSLNKFVCLLYGDKISSSTDECRFALFKTGKCFDEALPPSCDCLFQHIKRSNFQAAAWNHCLSPQLQLPTAVGSGWLLIDSQLQIVWMTRPSAPDWILESVQCKCRTGCKTLRCSCLKSGLKCTDLCCCNDCQNGQLGHNDGEDDEDEPSELSDTDEDDESSDEYDDDFFDY